MPIVDVDRGNYDAIHRKALERFLLDLARGYAAEEERISFEREGREPNILIRDVQLAGEYPQTGFQIRKYDRNRDIEQTSWWPIYESPTFFDENGKRRCEPERIVEDTLMLARGG